MVDCNTVISFPHTVFKVSLNKLHIESVKGKSRFFLWLGLSIKLQSLFLSRSRNPYDSVSTGMAVVYTGVSSSILAVDLNPSWFFMWLIMSWSAGQLWMKASSSYMLAMYLHSAVSLVGTSKLRKALAPILMCCNLGISSQSKQDMVSPVRKRVPLLARKSLILSRWDNKGCLASEVSGDSNFRTYILNFVYRFSMRVATSLSWKLNRSILAILSVANKIWCV